MGNNKLPLWARELVDKYEDWETSLNNILTYKIREICKAFNLTFYSGNGTYGFEGVFYVVSEEGGHHEHPHEGDHVYEYPLPVEINFSEDMYGDRGKLDPEEWVSRFYKEFTPGDHNRLIGAYSAIQDLEKQVGIIIDKTTGREYLIADTGSKYPIDYNFSNREFFSEVYGYFQIQSLRGGDTVRDMLLQEEYRKMQRLSQHLCSDICWGIPVWENNPNFKKAAEICGAPFDGEGFINWFLKPASIADHASRKDYLLSAAKRHIVNSICFRSPGYRLFHAEQIPKMLDAVNSRLTKLTPFTFPEDNLPDMWSNLEGLVFGKTTGNFDKLRLWLMAIDGVI